MFTTTSSAAATSITILNKGKITGVLWGAIGDSVADNVVARAELSKQQTSGLSSDGVQGQIVSAFEGIGQNVLTSGFSNLATNLLDAGLDCPVIVGDKLFLNTTISSGCSIKCIVKVQE